MLQIHTAFVNNITNPHSHLRVAYHLHNFLVEGNNNNFCVYFWDARTRLPGEHTRVRRGGTRRRRRDAADRASVPRRATWRFPNRADSVRIGRNGRVRPKFEKKKKKKVQNAPFDLT